MLFHRGRDGQAWDKDGMTPHAAVVENGRDRWKAADDTNQIQIQIRIQG